MVKLISKSLLVPISYLLCCQGCSITLSIISSSVCTVWNPALTLLMFQFVDYAIQLHAIIDSVLNVGPSLAGRKVLPLDSIKY